MGQPRSTTTQRNQSRKGEITAVEQIETTSDCQAYAQSLKPNKMYSKFVGKMKKQQTVQEVERSKDPKNII